MTKIFSIFPRLKYFYSKTIGLFLGLFIIFIFYFVLHFYAFAQSPDNPLTMRGSEFRVCTVGVDQPSCYSGNSPTPTLKWSFNSSNGASNQVAFRIQIDDNGNHNGNYPSPELDVIVNSSATKYTVPGGKLDFNTNYYWKVAVKDNFGTWSGWTCANSSFTTAGGFPSTVCGSGFKVYNGQTKAINCHGICKNVKAQYLPEPAIFVPTKTFREWSDFLNWANGSNKIILSDCCST